MMGKHHQSKLVVLSNLKLEVSRLEISEVKKKSLLTSIKKMIRLIRAGAGFVDFWPKVLWLRKLIKTQLEL